MEKNIKLNKKFNIFNWNFNLISVLIFLVSYFIFLNVLIYLISSYYNFPVDALQVSIPIYSYSCIFGIAALSLNLEIGNTGLTDFGKVAFIMIGAYATAMMILFEYDVVIAFAVGILFSAFFGYLVSIPTLKLKADYLDIVTIVIGVILQTFLIAEPWLEYPQNGKNGGAIGLHVPNIFRQIEFNPITIGSYTISGTMIDDIIYAIVLVICLLIIYLILEKLYNSPWGRILKSIRENDVGSESLGKDVVKFKTQSFVLSCAIAGFSGGLYVYLVSIAPSGFQPIVTFNLWFIVIIGGFSNNRGVIVGSFLFWTLNYLTSLFNIQIATTITNFSNFSNFFSFLSFHISSFSFNAGTLLHQLLNIDPISGQNILLGIIMIIFLLYAPQGLISEKSIETINTEDLVSDTADQGE